MKVHYSALIADAGQNPARQAAMQAGIPKEVPSTSLNMLCGSGLRAVTLGYQAILCGESSVVVAGGQESMSQVRSLYMARIGHSLYMAWLGYWHYIDCKSFVSWGKIHICLWPINKYCSSESMMQQYKVLYVNSVCCCFFSKSRWVNYFVVPLILR